MVGFSATGTITAKDFADTVIPQVKQLVERTDMLNYMLVLDTPVKNFIMGAWIKNAILDIKHITRWHRAAIVCDIDSIRTFTELFSPVKPGEFRGFKHADMDAAISWTSGD